jgi:CubicO group peptidase (beta-lactamase class C family)
VSETLKAAVAAAALAIAETAQADSIDEYVRAQLARNRIPALSLAVIRDGKVAKLQSYGVANLEWGSPATDDTRYQLASATKPFTGTLLMQLVEQGKLALDDSVAKVLPEAPESWKPITVRHLGTHMSGLKEVDAGKLATVEAIVAAAMREPLAYEPGTRSTYGFTDYVVLARILEKVSGKPYAALLRDALATPLGMTSTGFDYATADGPIRVAHVLGRRASVYRWDGAAQRVFEFLYGIPGYAAGGLYSSASDLARFFSALEQGRLLKPASLREMWTRPSLRGGDQADFGLGWVVGRRQGRLTVGHSGGPALADLLYFPDEKLAIVVLLNQQRMFPYLAEGIADLALPPGKVPPAIADADPALTARLRAVLASAGEGRVNADEIAEASRTELMRTLQEMGPIVIGMLDPIQGLELVEEQKEAGRWTRKYRVMFGPSARYWLFDLTAAGRIAAMRPASE